MAIETGDRVVLEYVGRLPDGTVFDTSREDVAAESDLETDREYEPLTVEIGAERIIPGLADGLLGLEEGDVETIEVAPEDGYGERSDERLMEWERADFDEMLQGEEVEVGMRVQSQQGEMGEVIHADDETVRVDFNHELAGETLEFEVEILEVEAADDV